MNILIYAAKRDFDVQKAERYFKERRIPYAFVDLNKRPLSAKEIRLFLDRLGAENLLKPSDDWQYHYLMQLSDKDAVARELLDRQKLIRTPLVRNGNAVTAGYCPDVWADWK